MAAGAFRSLAWPWSCTGLSCGVQGHAGCFGKRAGGARCPGFQVRGVGQLWLEGQVRDLLGGAADASRRGLRPRAASVWCASGTRARALVSGEGVLEPLPHGDQGMAVYSQRFRVGFRLRGAVRRPDPGGVQGSADCAGSGRSRHSAVLCVPGFPTLGLC